MILEEEEKVFLADENNPQALLDEFFSRYEFYNEEDRVHISQAWNLLLEKCGDKKRSCGTPYYVHPLRVADILAKNKMDAHTIIVAIIHTINIFGVTPEDIKEQFGEQVYKILSGLNKIMDLPINSKTLVQADSFRKMLFAMVDDVRIILIKLADRLDRIRHIKSLEKEEQRELAEEIIDIWAPLADRLGMQTEKNEFEDLSLRYTNPEAYLQIQEIVNQSKSERAAYLETATNKIKSSAYKMGFEVTVMSRAKHFYSIYQKMRKRNKSASELYDLLALRILCNSNAECYTLIGIVHGLWTPLEGRFKDYIAVPKANGYQSLHTTVMCDGKPLEIQIRTYEMHNMAEHGIASHWLYKKGTNHDLVEADKLEIFNKLQKLKESAAVVSAPVPAEENSDGEKSSETARTPAFMDEATFKNLKNELLGDEIYVFTPKGDVKKLPAGATAIDFAYAIHSGVGEKIIAAKADGKIIPLNKPLQNTQIVEVITNPNAHPTENQLSLVKTSKAHQRIHSWLMTNDPTFSERQTLQKIEEANNASANAAETVRQRKKRSKTNPNPEAAIKKEPHEILVQGERKVMYSIAQCCRPEYPNLICGYVTRTKGVSIHRADCLIYQSNPEKDKRSVEVSWGKSLK